MGASALSLFFHRLLRSGSRILRAVLPTHRYLRLRRAVGAGLAEYRRGREISVEPSGGGDVVSLLLHRVSRDEVAAPLGPVVGLRDRPETCALVLCCAFTGRREVLERIVAETLTAREAAGLRWMLVGSTADDLELIQKLAARDARIAGCIIENKPLGRKWQSCVHFATRHFDAELYAIVGSDDFLSSTLLDHIITRHRHNLRQSAGAAILPAMYGTLEWLVCNINDASSFAPQIMRCSYGYDTAFQPLGAGRFYTKDFLGKRGGLIFESNKERLLDDRGFFDVQDNGFAIEYYRLEDGPLVSVKGNWEQLNKIDAFLSAQTLKLQEFSFEGRDLIRRTMNAETLSFMFGHGCSASDAPSACGGRAGHAVSNAQDA